MVLKSGRCDETETRYEFRWWHFCNKQQDTLLSTM